MTDKVQKIKDWISKTQDGLMDDNGNFENTSDEGAFHILSNLDYYIDSLQEEPVSEDFEMALTEMVAKAQKCVVEPWVVAAQWKDELIKLAKSEEPVSKELEKAAEQDVCEVVNTCSAIGIPNDHIPSWVQEAMVNEFIHGAKWQKANLWKPADGDDLPEYEREVVAFQEIFPTDVDVPSLLKIVIAHRPNPEGYDGKSITTGQVEHYTPETYDKGGWNIPDIKWWLDVEFPKER